MYRNEQWKRFWDGYSYDQMKNPNQNQLERMSKIFSLYDFFIEPCMDTPYIATMLVTAQEVITAFSPTTEERETIDHNSLINRITSSCNIKHPKIVLKCFNYGEEIGCYYYIPLTDNVITSEMYQLLELLKSFAKKRKESMDSFKHNFDEEIQGVEVVNRMGISNKSNERIFGIPIEEYIGKMEDDINKLIVVSAIDIFGPEVKILKGPITGEEDFGDLS